MHNGESAVFGGSTGQDKKLDRFYPSQNITLKQNNLTYHPGPESPPSADGSHHDILFKKLIALSVGGVRQFQFFTKSMAPKRTALRSARGKNFAIKSLDKNPPMKNQ